MQNENAKWQQSHIFHKTTPESGSHILVLQPECDIIMSAKEKQDKKNKIRKTNFRKEE